MKTVYLLRSIADPSKRYVGITSDLAGRVSAHNAGRSRHTAKFRPWELIVHLVFDDDQRARDFERYLKSGSGSAFANKRLW